MMPQQTLAEFYAAKLRQPLPDSLRSGGHFAVFRLEDFAADTALAAAYGRRDFYKIMLGTGHATYHYGAQRQLLEPGQQALVFTNAQVPYGWEVHGLPYRGYCCVFTEAFVLAYSRLPPGELAVFQPEAVPFFRLTEAQAATFNGFFERMLAEQSSAYPHKYELLFHYLLACVHEAQKLAPALETRGSSAATRLANAFGALLAQQFPIVSPAQRLAPHTAQAYADQLAVHVNSLNRALKTVTGLTTRQLLAERLVQEARALLTYTDWPIGTIGYCLGFNEPTHFTHFFKQHARCTPSAVRQV